MRFINNYIEKTKNYMKENNMKYYIETMGCAMNENDSAKYSGIMASMGITKADKEEDANIVLFNTCCVRENAEKKLFGRLGILKEKKMKEKDFYIAIVGCMTQQEHIIEKIKTSYPFVDIVLGTHSIDTFPNKLYNAVFKKIKTREHIDTEGKVVENVPIIYEDNNKASISIIYGCNNFCTYCIVPYVRGRERSRKMEDIIENVKDVASKGYKEITLLGQNVNSYGKDLNDESSSFAKLLIKINEIDGIEIIRFVSPHPKDFGDDVIDAIKACDKVSKQIHLPLQSGSTEILNKMNRKYTKEDYLKLVKKMREKIPSVSFTTDVIVGFPGETDEDFEETLDVVRKVRYDLVYMFIYSIRKGTIAEKMHNQIPEDIKTKRLETLKYLNKEIVEEVNKENVGKIFPILIEGKSKNNNLKYTGRTPQNKVVIFDANEELIGKIRNIKITSQHLWYLSGEIIK
ncbi:MAG: tRNA (N6-isopentenyl adenosine(37)-C2)-methylthiotransferase MiaB [Clostridia bacterium]